MVKRVLGSSLIVLSMAFALLSPAVAADGATSSRWSAYLWSAGASCTYDTAYFDGSTEESRLRVTQRSNRAVRVRWSDSSIPQVWRLAPRGRMVQPSRSVHGATTIVAKETYPTVAQIRAKRSPTSMTVTRRVKYTAKDAKGFLTSGRTMVVTARYRVVGLGEKTLSLPSGPVSAIGVGLRLRSISVSHVRKAEVARVKDFYRGEIRAGAGDEWWSKGRGVVLWTFGSADSPTRMVQRSCA